jgi:hypothetical protein
MPELTHDWRNLGESQLLAWLVAEESKRGNVLDTDGANRLRDRIWHVSKDEEKRAWRLVGKRDGLTVVRGVKQDNAEKPEKPKRKIQKLTCGDEDVFRIGEKAIDVDKIEEMQYMEDMPDVDAVKWLCDLVGYEWDAADALREFDDGWLFTWNQDGTVQGSEYETHDQMVARLQREADKKAKAQEALNAEKAAAAKARHERDERNRIYDAEIEEKLKDDPDFHAFKQELIDHGIYIPNVGRIRRMYFTKGLDSFGYCFPDVDLREIFNANRRQVKCEWIDNGSIFWRAMIKHNQVRSLSKPTKPGVMQETGRCGIDISDEEAIRIESELSWERELSFKKAA